MAKYIIKRVAMGIFSIFIVATVTLFCHELGPRRPFVAEKSISKQPSRPWPKNNGSISPSACSTLII